MLQPGNPQLSGAVPLGTPFPLLRNNGPSGYSMCSQFPCARAPSPPICAFSVVAMLWHLHAYVPSKAAVQIELNQLRRLCISYMVALTALHHCSCLMADSPTITYTHMLSSLVCCLCLPMRYAKGTPILCSSGSSSRPVCGSCPF